MHSQAFRFGRWQGTNINGQPANVLHPIAAQIGPAGILNERCSILLRFKKLWCCCKASEIGTEVPGFVQDTPARCLRSSREVLGLVAAVRNIIGSGIHNVSPGTQSVAIRFMTTC
jgi:hypothetical protein